MSERKDQRGEFPCLDALRALGALAVVGTHVGFNTGRVSRGPFAASIARLDCGVAVFFVLSGFLLFRPYVLAALTLPVGSMPRPALGVYLRRRAVRILPAYWLAVSACMLLLPAIGAARGPAGLLRHLTLTQIYSVGIAHRGLTQTWSLCTEVAFYLALPLLARVVLLGGGRRWTVLSLSVLGLASAAWNPLLNSTGLLDIRTAGLWLPGYLDWFLAGMALALAQVRLAGGSVPGRGLARLRELADSPASCWGAAVAVFAVATSPLAGPTTIRAVVDVPTSTTILVKNVLYLLLAVLLLLPMVLGPQEEGMLRRVLASRPLRRLGRGSYGIFLWHLGVLEVVIRLRHQQLFTGSWLVGMAVTVPITVAIAEASYRFVEAPLLRGRRTAVAVPRPRTSPDQTAPSPTRQSA